MFRRPAFAALLALSFFAAAPAAFAADEKPIGANEYTISCGGCHGAAGDGKGDFASMLTVPPADLTALAKKNGGVFPLQQVYDIIDGRRTVRGHGVKDMPIWGVRYRVDLQQSMGPIDPAYAQADLELGVQARILSLIYYIQTIQKP
jgi:mono/diheme cytochrome c family protein